MRWCNRHLNWTLMLTYIIAVGVCIMAALMLETRYTWAIGIAFLSWLIINGWYLRMKERSIAWILLNIIGAWGVAIILGLENKRSVKG